MHPDFQTVKQDWWWAESPAALKRFCTDSFAQGFELLRRSNRIAPRLAASNCQPSSTWKQLYRIQKDYFSVNYRRALIALGLHKRIWAGPGGITFDVTQSNDTLLKALRVEIERPTPFGCGGLALDDEAFRTFARFQAHPKDEEINTPRPTDNLLPRPHRHQVVSHTGLWSHSGHETNVAHLPLPRFQKFGEDRALSDREAFAYFRNFIKDNPPPDFAAYRASLPKAVRHKRALEPRVLALGFMAHDYAHLPDSTLAQLGEWLTANSCAKKIFDLDQSTVAKALHNSMARVNNLLSRLDQPD